MTTPTRERAVPAGGVAVAERPRVGSGAGPGPQAARVLAAQRSAGNGAVGRALAGGEPAAMAAVGVAGPVSAMPAAAPVPVGPIPELVPSQSAAEAREAQPERRSWWDRVKSAVSDALASIGAGLGSLSSRVLGAVAERARQIPGYGLLTLALGRDVVTRQEVPRTPVNLIGALVGLIPGGAAMFENIQRARVLERAAAWFGAEVPKLGLTWEAIQGLFRRAWDALGVRDLLDPAGAWGKISAIFGPPLTALRNFAVAAGTKLLEFVFEGGLSLAGPLGGQVMGIVRRAGGVLTQIVRDPIGFAGNLVRAVRGGLGQFMTNIGSHLRTGLFAWLTGALRGAITLPTSFDLRGILSLAMQVLGLTWAWLRTRLVRLLGEPRVRLLETAVDWVQRIATQGLSAIWDRIAEFATGLFDTVVGGIRDWVARSVVGAAITRLITMFNPAGAVIQAIIAAYNTVRFFIERAQQIGALAESVFSSIGAIAGGAVGAAVTRVEQSLARALPVALGFLARLLGLGDIATPVRNLIGRARGVLDRAMDRVVEWLAGLARRLVAPRGSSPDASGERQGSPAARLARATSAAEQMMQSPDATLETVRAGLAPIQRREQLASLDLVNVSGHEWRVLAKINPELPSETKRVPSADELAAIKEQAADIVRLWRANGVAEDFRQATPAQRRRLLLDGTNYESLPGRKDLPTISSGDLVEAAARPGVARLAARLGSTLVVNPELLLCDEAGQDLGAGRIDEIDFLLAGESEIRVLSAKTQRQQFDFTDDVTKLELFEKAPDNPAAFDFVSNFMNWRGGRISYRKNTGGLLVRSRNLDPMRLSDFRSRYLRRERTTKIIVEPVHPRGQGEAPDRGFTLRVDLKDLVDLYVREVRKLL